MYIYRLSLSKNDPTSSDFDPNYAEPAKANDSAPAAANDPTPAESAPAVATDSASSIQPASGDATPPVMEPKIISKEFDINLSGKLDVPDGFVADTEQKMKKIELSGEESVINGLKDPEIDLAKIKIDKAGKIELTVKDLGISKDVSLVSAKDDDTVLIVTVTEKPKDDPKKDEKVSASVDATVPAKDEIKVDDKKDDPAGSGGDPNNNSNDPTTL